MTLCFVCGALRSGTTLLRLILDHHPDIADPGEADFLFDYLQRGEALGEYHLDVERLSNDRIFNARGLSLRRDLPALDCIRDLVRQSQGDESVLALSIHRHFDIVSDVFPEAFYIHLLRDPRDVARSSVAMGWAGNAAYGVDHWIDSERAWDRLVRRIDKHDWIEVKYESLLAAPNRTVDRITDFLGVPFDPGMLDYPSDTTYSAPDPKNVYRWRDKLSRRQVQAIESKLGRLLIDKGYAPSGFESRGPTAFEAKLLWLGNKMGRWRFLIRRYGLFLTVTEKVTRWLGLKRMHTTAARRINAITIQNLK